ncbi:MOSC domain-containing protein [Thalassospira sp. MA62]|nr:MOSC domain-containing protein [Thalassospira sp. MA62]
MSDGAKLIGIARRRKSRAPMETLDNVKVTTDLGVDGDVRGKLRRRQITVLAVEDWDAACAEISKPDLPWTVRRANFLVSGIALPRDKGARIAIGDVVLQITGETDPCKFMDDAVPGLKDALTPEWRGGVTCRVIEGGHAALGDPVTVQ